MGRRGLLSAALVGGVLFAGCGGDEGSEVPTFTGSDEEQIAGTVNAMTAAIAAGDGATACGLMTERGQRVMLQIGRQAGGEEVADCAAAVPAASSFGFDPGDYRVTAAEVAISGNPPSSAEANCDYGAFQLERTDEGWRVNAPWCVT
ncbi:MAG TPA: hypothetical protein VFH44_07715 [Solirubrobacterales bacterium]|nr:hypothetical protein [Solirubrobacterales bacterium]